MSDLDQPGAPGSNTGHGHVYPRPDGARARCGGPALCGKCAADLARKSGSLSGEDERRRAWEAGHAALASIEPFLDTLDGFVAATRARRWSDAEARALVAYMFGYRAPPTGEQGGTP